MDVLGQDSFTRAWKKGYKGSDEGFSNTIKGIIDANWQYVCHHPLKTTAVIVGTISVAALTAAYFTSPAYAGFVNTTAQSSYAGMVAGVKGLYALAMTNPVFTGLLAAAIVVTIGALIYMNYSKASQIEEVKKKILAGYGDDEGKLEIDGECGATYLTDIPGVNPLRVLREVAGTVKLPMERI
ncbi:hypothetical protein [Wolbachia endosymbiont of Ctenocephalides felis wCfeJ]|uniref:hypothetical protein n=1 Tax=Wolbachia endosymbiont of Ctenocephalides felis wCfeJ TaxID=2732594 RepID=UPI001447ED1F|nr:hypothetical protein [Wolbachia endosymbiont of Ctenocephalides felis wCfeJ]